MGWCDDQELEAEAGLNGLVYPFPFLFIHMIRSAHVVAYPNPQTYAIDRDAAIHFIHAAASHPPTTRFLIISYLASRRTKPAWWSDADWSAAQRLNTQTMPHYYAAKLAADEALYTASKDRGSAFVGINLRPGTLTLEPAGKVELGKTKRLGGDVSRESVAQVADLLLASEGVKNSWLDMLDGEEEVAKAVERVVSEGVDAAEGDPVFEG